MLVEGFAEEVNVISAQAPLGACLWGGVGVFNTSGVSCLGLKTRMYSCVCPCMQQLFPKAVHHEVSNRVIILAEAPTHMHATSFNLSIKARVVLEAFSSTDMYTTPFHHPKLTPGPYGSLQSLVLFMWV